MTFALVGFLDKQPVEEGMECTGAGKKASNGFGEIG